MKDDTLEHRRDGISNRLIVTVEQDTDATNPLEDCDGTWTIYHFGSDYRQRDGKTADDFMFTETGDYRTIRNIVIAKKLSVGLAFWFTGDGDYSEFQVTQDDDYTRHHTGIMVWENKPKDMGARSYADRMQDAKNELEAYDAWCRGDACGYRIEDGDGEDVESCWGFIGPDHDYVAEEIRSTVRRYADRHGFKEIVTGKGTDPDTLYVKVTGDYSEISDWSIWQPAMQKAA